MHCIRTTHSESRFWDGYLNAVPSTPNRVHSTDTSKVSVSIGASIGWRWHEVGMWCQQKIVFDYELWRNCSRIARAQKELGFLLSFIIVSRIASTSNITPNRSFDGRNGIFETIRYKYFIVDVRKISSEKFPDNSIEHYLFVILTWSYLCARWNIWLFRCGIFIWIVLGFRNTMYERDFLNEFDTKAIDDWFHFRFESKTFAALNWIVCVCVYDSVVVWSYCIIIWSLWQWHHGNHARFQLLRNRIVVQFLPRIDLCCAISFAIRFYYNRVTLGAESIIFRFLWLLLSLRRSCLLAARRSWLERRGECARHTIFLLPSMPNE